MEAAYLADSQRVSSHLASVCIRRKSHLRLSVVCVLTLRYIHNTCRCPAWQPADSCYNVITF